MNDCRTLWNITGSHPHLEIILSEIEKDFYRVLDTKLDYSKLSNKEWYTIRFLAASWGIFIKKKLAKGLMLLFGITLNILEESEKQLSDINVCKDVSFNLKIL